MNRRRPVLSAGLRPRQPGTAQRDEAPDQSGWQILPQHDTEMLVPLILDTIRTWYARCLPEAENPQANAFFELRDAKIIDGWWLGQLLTPSALYRICLPMTVPNLPLPEQGFALQPCQLLGPQIPLQIPDVPGRTHLYHLPELGHFLLQPEVYQVQRYPDADAVFAAWDTVVAFRQRARERIETEKTATKNYDRRDFLRKFIPT